MVLVYGRSDEEKRPNSSMMIDDAPGWNEDLATPSEAYVKVRRPLSSGPSLSCIPGGPRDDHL